MTWNYNSKNQEKFKEFNITFFKGLKLFYLLIFLILEPNKDLLPLSLENQLSIINIF